MLGNLTDCQKRVSKTIVTSGNSFAPELTFIHNRRIIAKFKKSYLMQDNIYFIHRNVINLLILYN